MVDIADLTRRMEGALGAFQNDLGGLRTGRASAGLVENINVEVYGSPMPLSQVATINVPEPRTISLQVWDQGNVPSVEKAIQASGLGITPATDGNLIRLPLPEMTEERRKEMVKLAAKYAEEKRIAVRNVRRDGMDAAKKAEKDGDISKDEMHGISDDIQKLTDDFVGKIDEALSAKEKEILTV